MARLGGEYWSHHAQFLLHLWSNFFWTELMMCTIYHVGSSYSNDTYESTNSPPFSLQRRQRGGGLQKSTQVYCVSEQKCPKALRTQVGRSLRVQLLHPQAPHNSSIIEDDSQLFFPWNKSGKSLTSSRDDNKSWPEISIWNIIYLGRNIN